MSCQVLNVKFLMLGSHAQGTPEVPSRKEGSSLLALTCWQRSSRGSPGCCQPSVLLTHVQFAVIQGAPGPSLQSCSPISGPPTKPRGRAVHFPLLTFLRFLSAYSSSLLRSLNHSITKAVLSTTPPNFLSSSNSLNVHSAASLMSFHQGIRQY